MLSSFFLGVVYVGFNVDCVWFVRIECCMKFWVGKRRVNGWKGVKGLK